MFPQIVLTSILVFLVSACVNHDITPSATVTPVINDVGINPNVYVAGAVGSAAVLWKNGIADTIDQGCIRSLFIDGSDVYAAGWQWQPKIINGLPLPLPVAAYWKNGVPVVLSDTSRVSYVQSIFVADNHVYAVGHEQDITRRSSVPFKAKCWKDGLSVTLSSPDAINSDAFGVFVSGADLYVVGWTRNLNKGIVATYWKNGVPVYLTDGTVDCTAKAIVVAGTDVYVAGTVNFQDMNTEGGFVIYPQAKCVATYWKNGKPFALSTEGSYASSIFVNGTDVYVAGTIGSETAKVGSTPLGSSGGNVATYWKNGVQINLNDDNQESLATSISVTKNGDVYLAGTIDFQAVWWVNGSRTYFSNDLSGIIQSSLYSILLTN